MGTKYGKEMLHENDYHTKWYKKIVEFLFETNAYKWIIGFFWFLTIVVLLIGLSSMFEIVNRKTELEKGKKVFFLSLDKLFITVDSTAMVIQPIKTIFNSVDRETNGELFKYGFINSLEDYYKYKIINDSVSTNKNIVLLNFIRKEIDQEPFRQLKPEQQRILTSLNKSILAKDSTLAMVNLSDLNDIMRISNVRSAELENENSFSLPLAIAGTILTIVFGIMALFKRPKNH